MKKQNHYLIGKARSLVRQNCGPVEKDSIDHFSS